MFSLPFLLVVVLNTRLNQQSGWEKKIKPSHEVEYHSVCYMDFPFAVVDTMTKNNLKKDQAYFILQVLPYC